LGLETGFRNPFAKGFLTSAAPIKNGAKRLVRNDKKGGLECAEFSPKFFNQGEVYVSSNWLLHKPMGLEFSFLSRYASFNLST